MTPAQLRIVQRTFAIIEKTAEQFSAQFYERLFQLDPEIRSLFRNDIKAQHSKFMKVIAEVIQLHLRALMSLPVTASERGQALIPGAYWSGKLHYAYGVKAEHFTTMKEALFWTMEKTLGPEFTPEAHDAWNTAYDIISRAMQSGMSELEEDLPENRKEEPHNTNEAKELSELFDRLGRR